MPFGIKIFSFGTDAYAVLIFVVLVLYFY